MLIAAGSTSTITAAATTTTAVSTTTTSVVPIAGHVSVSSGASGWDILTAVATAAAALFTATAAGVTAFMAFETRKMAEKTAEEAKATASAAKASEEAAKATAEAAEASKVSAAATLQLAEQGALAYRPALAREVVRTQGHDREIQLYNLGAGGAVGVVYAVRIDGSDWSKSQIVHLPGGSDRPVMARTVTGAAVPFVWFTEVNGAIPCPEVIFCQDVLRARYRFLIDENGMPLAPERRSWEECQGPGDEWWNDPTLWA